MSRPTEELMILAEYFRRLDLRADDLPVTEIEGAITRASMSDDTDSRIAAEYAREYMCSISPSRTDALPQTEAMDEDLFRTDLRQSLGYATVARELPALTDDPSQWLPTAQQPSNEKILVIHGTWASGDWWLPGSQFMNYLDSVSNGAVYKGADAFQWSGDHSHQARSQAGRALSLWLEQHPAVETIIAHSHGGNVAFIAGRRLANESSQRRLRRLILLGTPTRTDYPPEMRMVDLTVNVYSLGDIVQTPVGSAPYTRGEGRCVSDSSSSINVVAEGNGHPGHTELHEDYVWTHNRLNEFLL